MRRRRRAPCRGSAGAASDAEGEAREQVETSRDFETPHPPVRGIDGGRVDLISTSSEPCTSARWDEIASVLAPRLLRSIQQKSESIENIAAKDSHVLIDHEKLTAEGPA